MANNTRPVDARQVTGYLDPKYSLLFNSYAKVNEMGKSEVINLMARFFFDRMPEAERQKLLTLALE